MRLDQNMTTDKKSALSGALDASQTAWLCEAGDGARTHDPQLGKLMLYQLSYARVANHLTPGPLGPLSHVRGQTPDVSVADKYGA